MLCWPCVVGVSATSAGLVAARISIQELLPSGEVMVSIHENYYFEEFFTNKRENGMNTMDEKKVIDLELGMELICGDRTIAIEMLKILIVHLPNERKQLKAAVDELDLDQIGRLMHRLYGGLSYIGVPSLQETTCLLERMVDANDVVAEHIIEASDNVLNEMDRLEVAWKQLLEQEEIEKT